MIRKTNNLKAGFTLPEVMVAVFIFSLLFGGAVGLLVSSLSAQKTSLRVGRAVREGSSVAEYMGRALRQAQKELNASPSNCLTTAGKGYNYELDITKTRIRFLSHDNFCQEFFLSGTQIMERKSTTAFAVNFPASPVALTSTNVTVSALNFTILGQGQADTIQPRATFFIQINGIQIQTTISQRNFDVQQ